MTFYRQLITMERELDRLLQKQEELIAQMKRAGVSPGMLGSAEEVYSDLAAAHVHNTDCRELEKVWRTTKWTG